MVARQCSLYVSVNMFWKLVAPTAAKTDLSSVDRVASWAQAHGMGFRGTPLVWHHQTPSWYDALPDRAAAVRALEERLIAGAALDVFHQEPLPPDHPLWHLPNVFISPHSAGLTSQYDERSATVFEENMRRYLVGEPLYNVVDKRQGY